MATAIIYQSVNMNSTSVTFAPAQSYASSAGVTFVSSAIGDAYPWTIFQADEGHEIIYSGSGASLEITGGTFDYFQYYNASALPVFNIHNTTSEWDAADVYDLFDAGDTQGIFALLLAGNDSLSAADFAQTLNGFGGNDTIMALGGNDKVYGGDGADALNGQVGHDQLFGGLGVDKLYGGAGNDTLNGGGGVDKLYFNTALASTGVDVIDGFIHLTDKIYLENAIFTQLGGAGALANGKFVTRNDITATSNVGINVDDRLLYDKDSGKLYYDTNGSGSGGRTLIADLNDTSAKLAMVSAADFQVI